MVGRSLYATKTCPAYIDMIQAPAILIAAQFHRGCPASPPEEIHAVHLAWAQAAA